MKTTILTTALVMFAMVQMSFATSKPTNNSLESKIAKEISYTKEIKEQNIQGFVLVSVLFNENGEFEIENVNSSNNTLKDYVVSKLKSLKFKKDDIGEQKNVSLKFNFKIL